MKRFFAGIALGVCLFGQATPYEVVSVKSNLSGETGSDMETSQGKLSATNMTVVKLIASAYGLLASERIEGGPPWIRSERYDIQAIPAAGAIRDPRSFHQELIKAILKDRFQLVTREETREAPIFVLTVDKQVKIRQSDGPPQGNFHANGGRMTARGVTMGQFVRWLETFAGRPVEDHTGLTGVYDFELEWTREPLAETAQAPSLFTALREQLGLRLSADKGPVKIVVVEGVERPGEN